METDAGRRAAAVAARRDAWKTMQPSLRRRMVRQAVKEFKQWMQQRRCTVVEKAD